eukprot:COSAG01_NODE_1944_length_8831_cov_18.803023_4_plen_144_part_00
MCSPTPTAGRCEERTKVKREGRSERTRSKSRHLLTPTLPRLLRAMPFVEVAMGLRAGICNILNHAFSPHLASTGLHCLVVDAPLALRYHVFVPHEKSGADVDEYQEMGETEAHWANIEILRSHCKVYGLAQDTSVIVHLYCLR